MFSASTSKNSCISWIAPCVCTSPACSDCYSPCNWPRLDTSERCPRSRWLDTWMDICKYRRFLCSGLVHLTLVRFDVASADSTEVRSCTYCGEWSGELRWMTRLFVAIRPSEDSWTNLSSFGGLLSTANWRRWEKAPKQPVIWITCHWCWQ